MSQNKARTQPNAPDQFFAVTPSDATLLQGLQYLRVTVTGDLVLKGVQDSASAVTIAVTAGEWVPFGAGYVMAATTATVKGFA